MTSTLDALSATQYLRDDYGLNNHADQRTTVYTVLRSVSRSGMSRRIDVYTASVGNDGMPAINRITHLVAKVIGGAYDPGKGLRVDGAGMDMGYHVVYSLARALTGDGYAFTHRWL
jgi:hypothetical protein